MAKILLVLLLLSSLLLYIIVYIFINGNLPNFENIFQISIHSTYLLTSSIALALRRHPYSTQTRFWTFLTSPPPFVDILFSKIGIFLTPLPPRLSTQKKDAANMKITNIKLGGNQGGDFFLHTITKWKQLKLVSSYILFL